MATDPYNENPSPAQQSFYDQQMTPQPPPQAPPQQPTWQPSPGLTSGVYQDQLSNLNRSGPGKAEQYYDANKNIWGSPSGGETNAWGIINQYSAGHPGGTQNTQDWFNQYKGQMPSISSEPGFGAYYDNAKNRAQESINQSMAARGAYGSSAANDQISRSFTDLEADRAKNEAQYNLQRLGEQRAWQGLGGQLAGQADSNSLASSQNDMGWADFLGKLGLSASQFGLGRTNAGMDAAANVDAINRNTGNDYFSQQLQLGDRLSGLMQHFYDQANANDAGILDKTASGGVAQANNAAANQDRNFNDAVSLAGTGMNLYDKYK